MIYLCFSFLIVVGILSITIFVAKQLFRDEIKLSAEYIDKLNLPKFDYTLDVIELIVNSTKLSKEEKEQTLNKVLAAVESTNKIFDKSGYLYFKSKI